MTSARFHTVHVQSVRPVTDELMEVRLDVGATGLQEHHTLPGQFVQLALPEIGESFFAIASAPSDGPVLELLLKRGGRVADALAQARPDAPVEISAPMGKGFPMDALEGRDLLLFATGSGISAIRPVVHYVAKHRARYGRVILFFGARTVDAFAYLEEIPRWERDRIEVRRVVSRPGSDEVWDGAVGYVQDVLRKVRPDVSRAAALLCGVKGMHEAVRQCLEQMGMPPERMLANY